MVMHDPLAAYQLQRPPGVDFEGGGVDVFPVFSFVVRVDGTEAPLSNLGAGAQGYGPSLIPGRLRLRRHGQASCARGQCAGQRQAAKQVQHAAFFEHRAVAFDQKSQCALCQLHD
ncbi:hypothetical protein [Desulfovibrio sp. ZJ200]|uniref:hypothetical protein n=1 Tax=Desulfovibrio sp. ZJ200 TaxID=2709792 RepID=UPI00197FBF50|nr:hypothetical protein [Desulfovibrio sp. ZJ200]